MISVSGDGYQVGVVYVVPSSLVPLKSKGSPAASKKYNPPLCVLDEDNILLPEPSIVAPLISSTPKPILLLFILLELSKRIKILAGTSPSPEPGGTGLARTDWLILNKNKIIINFLNVFIITS